MKVIIKRCMLKMCINWKAYTLMYCLIIVCLTECCRCSLSDCQDYKDLGHNTSAVYRVVPLGMYSEMDVYCDQVDDGGGWIVNIFLSIYHWRSRL